MHPRLRPGGRRARPVWEWAGPSKNRCCNLQLLTYHPSYDRPFVRSFGGLSWKSWTHRGRTRCYEVFHAYVGVCVYVLYGVFICPSPLLRITRLACHHCPPLSSLLRRPCWHVQAGLAVCPLRLGREDMGRLAAQEAATSTSSRTRNTTQIQAGLQHRAQIALLLLGQLAIWHSHRPRILAHRIMPAGAGGAARPPSAARLAGNGRTASPSTRHADSPIADYALESWDVRLNMGGMERSARSRCVWGWARPAQNGESSLARSFAQPPGREPGREGLCVESQATQYWR